MDTLRIVTLNCWGIPIPGICRKRSERIKAIGQELSEGDYHIVVLEEVWLKSDYDLLCKKVLQVLPHSQYFYSGSIGSGICLFSKLPILESFFHRYHLNGHAYKVQHGDWFGGKGVGLCKLKFQGFKINLYVSHIHAEYSRIDDEYLPHRVSQAFEMSQFIKLTSAECDVILAVGDFNMEPSDVGYKLLLTNTPLKDAWDNKKNDTESNAIGATCECPWNPFRDKSLAKLCPNGKRIDYIMYNMKQGVDISIERCYTTLGQVPGESFSFSDHEGVAAELEIKKVTTDESYSSKIQREDNEVYLRVARDIQLSGVVQVQRSMTKFQIQALGLSVLLYWLNCTDIANSNPQPISFLLSLLKMVLVILVAVLIWLSLVVKHGEKQGLLATKLDLDRLIADDVKN